LVLCDSAVAQGYFPRSFDQQPFGFALPPVGRNGWRHLPEEFRHTMQPVVFSLTSKRATLLKRVKHFNARILGENHGSDQNEILHVSNTHSACARLGRGKQAQ
jgi:hypothetical protein